MKKYLIIFLLLFSFSNNVYLKNKPFLDLKKINNLKSLSINKEQSETNQNEFNNQQVIQQPLSNQQISQQLLQQQQNTQQTKNIEIQEEPQNLMNLSDHDQDLISRLEKLIQPVKQSLQELIRLQKDEEINIFQPQLQLLNNEFDIQSEQTQQQIQQNNIQEIQENFNELLPEQQNQQIIQNNYKNSKQIQQLSKPVIDELNHIVDNLPEDQNFPKQSLNEIKDFIPQNYAGNKIIDEIQDTMQEQIIDKKDIKNLVQQINKEVQQQKQNYENSIDNIGEQVEVNDEYIRTYEDILKQINEQQQQKQQLINVLENKENIIEEQLHQNPQNNYQLQLNLGNLKENLQQQLQQQQEQQLIYDDSTKVYVDYLKNIVQQPENQIPSQIIQEVLDDAKSEHLEQPILEQMQDLLVKNQNEQIPTQNIQKTLDNIQDYVKKNKRDFNKNKKQTQFDSFQQQSEKHSFKNVFDINDSLNNIIKRVRNVQKTLNDIKYEFEIPKVLNEKPNTQMFNQLNQNAKNNQIPQLNEFINEDNYYQFE